MQKAHRKNQEMRRVYFTEAEISNKTENILRISISLDKFRQNSAAVLCMIQVPFNRQNVQTHRRPSCRENLPATGVPSVESVKNLLRMRSTQERIVLMNALRKEYVLLFNALTDTEEALRQLCADLISVQQQAEELFLEEPPDMLPPAKNA